MGVYLDPSDLTPFATVDAVKAAAMIEDAEAMAGMVAPCLSDINVTVPDAHRAAVKAILRGAILRWHEAGTGAVQSQAAGPLSMTLDTRQQRRGMFWPSEINQLQAVCAAITGTGSSAFQLDTIPAGYESGEWLAPDLWVPLS